MRIIFLMLFALLVTVPAGASTQDLYPFKTIEQQTQFTTLLGEFRCLVCQNQNLSDSNAPLAADLRHEIYLQIQSGHSNQMITDYLVARYGSYILYRPPFSSLTLLLWLGPFIVLVGGLSYLLFFLFSRQRKS